MSGSHPISPGVGQRRKHLPKLPLSAFNTTSNSSQFPSLPSPSSLHPKSLIDAHVLAGISSNIKGELEAWTTNATARFDKAPQETVIAISSTAKPIPEILKQLEPELAFVNAIAVSVPFLGLTAGPPSIEPSYLSEFPRPVALSVPVSSAPILPSLVAGLRWALSSGFPVELVVQDPLQLSTVVNDGEDNPDGTWGHLEELIQKIQSDSDNKRAIIINNILPPPAPIDLPIVKLLTDTGYIAYQSRVASLSLLSNTYLKFVPPTWTSEAPDGIIKKTELKDWKRRVKMYLGPAIEAFGDSRIVFGSSPLEVNPKSHISLGDWYAIARESIAELGVEQEGIDAIFAENARTAYGITQRT